MNYGDPDLLVRVKVGTAADDAALFDMVRRGVIQLLEVGNDFRVNTVKYTAEEVDSV